MSKRMTWPEIAEAYPNQWVGLTDVEYKPNNSATIQSAVVKYTDRSRSELQKEQARTKGKLLARYTNPNKLFQLGVLG